MAIYPPPTRIYGWQYWNAKIKNLQLGGGTTTVNTTSAELYTRAVNGNLTPGNRYRITDYKSVNFLNGFNLAKDFYNGGWSPQNVPAGTLLQPIAGNIGTDVSVFVIEKYDQNTYLIGGIFFSSVSGTPYSGAIARVNSDGTLDNTFTAPSQLLLNNCRAIAILPNGSILVGGDDGNTQLPVIYRLLPTGAIDPSFTPATLGPIKTRVYTIAVQPDGKILIGGDFGTVNGNTRQAFTRLNADGTEDSSFAANVGTGFNLPVRDIELLSDGSMLVGGYQFTTYNGTTVPTSICKINPNGTINASFTTNAAGGANDDIYSIKEHQGFYLLGGNFTTYGGVSHDRIVRILSNGIIDTGAWVGGTTFNAAISAIQVLANDEIVVGGGFTSVDSNPTGYIVKLDQTGVVSITDPLPLGTGFDNTILGLYYESDYNNTGIEAIIVGGVFFNYDSNSTSRVTALTLEPVPTPELNALELHVGEPEVLVVTAFTENRFEAQGYSETYGDIVEFNPMCNTISIPYYNGIYDGVTLPDSSILSGFDLQWDGQNAYFMMPAGYPILFGHFLYIEFDSGPGNFYYFFEDPILPGINYNKEDYGVDAFNFSAPYITISNDGTKVTLHGVTYQQFLDYTPGSLYLDVCIESFGAAYGYMTRRIDTTHQIDIPLDWRNFKYRRFEFVTTNVLGTTFISTNTGDTCSIPTVNSLTTGAYSDFPVIPSESFDVTITGYGGTTGYWFWSGNVENIASNQGGLMQNVHIKPGYMQNVLLDYTANVDIIASNIVVSTTRTLSNLNSLGECNINNIIIDNITSCTVGNISMASINTIVYTIFSYTVNITGDLTGSVNFGTSNFSKRILKDSLGNTLLEYFDGTTMQYVTSPF